MRVVSVGRLFFLFVLLGVFPRIAVGQTASPPTISVFEASGYAEGSIFLRWWPVSLIEDEISIERKESGDWVEIAKNVFFLNEYVDAGLPLGTVFTYRIRARNSAGFSDYSSALTVKVPSGPASAPPEAPALQIGSVSPHSVSLKWTAVEYVQNYSLERKTGTGDWVGIMHTDGGTISFADELVVPSTTYTYRVRARNGYGDSPYSSEVFVRTLDGPPAIPRAPQIWGFSNGKATSLYLKWYEIHNASGYLLEAKVGVDGNWAEVADIPAGATEFTHTNLTAATTYYYRLRAYNESGFSDYSAEYELTTNAPPPPAPVLRAAVLSYKEIELHWNDVATDFFTTYILEQNYGGFWNSLGTLGSNRTNYFSSGFAGATEYSFRIMARNAAGQSDWSYVTVTTLPLPEIPPQAPTLFADPISSTEVRLKWNSVELVNEYRVERKNPVGAWEEIAALSEYATSHTNSGLRPLTSYAYRIRALNSYGSSPYSNEAGAITPQRPEIPSLNGWAISQSVVELFWSPSYGAERYTIERKTSSGTWDVRFETTAEPFRYLDTGLRADTRYTYRLGAQHFSGEWFYSAELTAETYPPALFDPPQLSATPTSSTAILLSWEPLAHAEYYHFEKLVSGQWTTQQLDGSVTNFLDEGLSPATSYTYRIQGRNSAGGSLYSKQLTVTTPLPISGAIFMRMLDLSEGRLRLQLVGSSGQRFKIQRSGDFQSWNDATEVLRLSAGMEVDVEADTTAPLNFYRTIQVE